MRGVTYRETRGTRSRLLMPQRVGWVLWSVQISSVPYPVSQPPASLLTKSKQMIMKYKKVHWNGEQGEGLHPAHMANPMQQDNFCLRGGESAASRVCFRHIFNEKQLQATPGKRKSRLTKQHCHPETADTRGSNDVNLT